MITHNYHMSTRVDKSQNNVNKKRARTHTHTQTTEEPIEQFAVLKIIKSHHVSIFHFDIKLFIETII